jgi:hypothetical protein
MFNHVYQAEQSGEINLAAGIHRKLITAFSPSEVILAFLPMKSALLSG